ncbi:NAD(+) diphosphatase [Cellulomonas sp. zg-ZUI188]|uniref:NAD(+) diphosphatase n=1 Tax=Cellulomonas fengjieae TaxID=2819978 RepID=A0ABS3SD86_9CELL|nr:NAD(+) diphosphatase [Cellulomonas fengjieae]MBO3083716.1 NAD(+) diphosphatase [Cellulomonas fengjieae]QVI67953.1 NAD(+) diphosphatase [Cellulomonas fengjieae]
MDPDALPLSRAGIDRAAHLRPGGDHLRAALADPATRVLLVSDGAVVTSTGPRVALLEPAQAAHLAGMAGTAGADGTAGTDGTERMDDADDGGWLLLGRGEAGEAYLARRVAQRRPAPPVGVPSDVLVHPVPAGPDPTPERRALPDGLTWTPLRDMGAELSADDAGLATTAVALDGWHARHPRCPRCGARTRVAQSGWTRVCVADASEHYPRTDPAVIMAVVDADDRILLGHAAQWAEGRWSTLAGFVEPGESLEHAVRREVAEEAGVVVGAVSYRGSQPWPFPASLMIGFRATAETTDARADGVELTEVRWFTRGELADAVRAGDVIPPGRASIARALVEEWFGGPLS